jgi:hypothetical protein
MNEFKSITECQDYLRSKNLKKGVFFFNVYGWERFFTLEPTFCTPTGKHKDFPSRVQINLRSDKPKLISV